MFRIAPAQEPHEGRRTRFFGTGFVNVEADRYSGAPAGGSARSRSTKRVGGGGAKSRPRLRRRSLKGRTPGEHPAGGALTASSSARDSRQGRSPETAALRSGVSPWRHVSSRRQTVRGSFRSSNARIPVGRRKLRRDNPMSAAGVKQNRHGFEGSKPSRG